MENTNQDKESIVDQKKRIIAAGRKAVDELIKIAAEPIINGRLNDENSTDDGLSADKLTRAAQSKRIAIIDAFDILARCESEEVLIATGEGKDPLPTNWAEKRARNK